MPLGDAPGGSAAPKVRPGPLAHTWLPSHRSRVKVNPSSLADRCLWATRPGKMSQTAHGQGKAQSATLLLTSGPDAAAHGPGGHGANKSSVLANCGLGARPHSLLPRTRAWRIPESRRRARRRNATRRRPLTRRSGRCRPSPASRGCDVRSQRPPFCWGTDALGTSTPWGLTDT